MAYSPAGEADYMGFERITGTLAGRKGTFVLQQAGRFARGKAAHKWTVVPGSGTGELAGLRGEGNFEAGHQESYTMALVYRFE